ncbi:MAG: glycoside hydrolase family 57 [Alphaproteobacteria bacterium]|nr:glycoside hydrolase family 57 [Alphaproteobacteria bacterium]
MQNHVKVYSVFHLNMWFSSIEENQRRAVLETCYWPLIDLIQKGYPLAIEASGLSLEALNSLDPSWVSALRGLVASRACEFVGSGYAQIIGPLVPHEVNVHNLALGHDVYETLLGHRPKLALINEQAYSPSLVDIYLEAGYEAILMDWGNPYSHHSKTWSSEWRYYPQRAQGNGGSTIDLIWLDTIPFQRFQRYVHDELDIQDILDSIHKIKGDEPIAFPLYGNDAEIFNYRPGRFDAEPELGLGDEWERIETLYEALMRDDGLRLSHPSDVRELMSSRNAGNALTLESPDDPIPVKKQPKYNALRWAATGRDDMRLNTACWRQYHRLTQRPNATSQDWRRLCRLWSSDYRTHITESRWSAVMEEILSLDVRPPSVFTRRPHKDGRLDWRNDHVGPFHWRWEKRFLTIEGPSGRLCLRVRKGLAIEGLWRANDDQSYVRTIPHGYFDDINWGADFFTGHMIIQAVGRPQITDLEPVAPSIYVSPDEDFLDVEAKITTLGGSVFKRVRFFATAARVEVSYRIDWLDTLQGSVRLANLTLNPAGYDRASLYYETHNGGKRMDRHSLSGGDVNFKRLPSFLVSARAGTGMTEGVFVIGDKNRKVVLECPRDVAALPALVECQSIGASFFCRVSLSARESDDTAKPGPHLAISGRHEFMYAMTALDAGDPVVLPAISGEVGST